MPYRITIIKVEPQELLENYNYYYTDKELAEVRKMTPDHYNYEQRKHPVTKPVETQVYQQTIDGDIPLMEVIKAFNSLSLIP